MALEGGAGHGVNTVGRRLGERLVADQEVAAGGASGAYFFAAAAGS